MSSQEPLRAVQLMRLVTLGLGAVLVVLFLWVVIARFQHQVDAEWMTGSVRDAVERVRDGQPIYARPSASFISFLYPPLYYWVAGALAHVFSAFVSAKLVSVLATVATSAAIVSIATKLGATRFWAAVAVLLHVSCYSVTLFFFDIERVDAFSSAVVAVGLATLLDSRAWRTALGALLLGAAFFAKQPGLLAFVAAVAGLFFAGERRRGLIALAVGGATFALLLGYLELRTGGWFRYYCLKLPGTHGVEGALLTTFFIQDVPRVFVLALGTGAVMGPLVWSALRHRRPPRGATAHEIVFGSALAAGLAGAFFLRAHRGGWANVILAWTPLACAAAAIMASRAERRAQGTPAAGVVSLLLLGSVSLQFLGAAYDPTETGPNSVDAREHRRFTELVRKLEQQGEVVVTTMGNVTRVPHFHAAALFDVLRGGDPAPADYVSGLAERRYAALFAGAPDEFFCEWRPCKELSEVTLRNYFVAARLEDRPHTGLIGFDGRPRWILRPRTRPPESLTREQLEQRQRAEIAIAEARRWAAKPGSEVLPEDDIEELAARPNR